MKRAVIVAYLTLPDDVDEYALADELFTHLEGETDVACVHRVTGGGVVDDADPVWTENVDILSEFLIEEEQMRLELGS